MSNLGHGHQRSTHRRSTSARGGGGSGDVVEAGGTVAGEQADPRPAVEPGGGVGLEVEGTDSARAGRAVAAAHLCAGFDGEGALPGTWGSWEVNQA